MSRELLSLLLIAITLIAGMGIYPSFATAADEAAVDMDDGASSDEIIVGDTNDDGDMADTEEPDEMGEE